MQRLSSDLHKAWVDFKMVASTASVWTALGWNDVQGRYNRSKLGVVWAGLSILVFVSALGPIYSRFFGMASGNYVLHLMLGLIAWNYLQAIIMESGREFVNSAHYKISFQISYFTLLFRVVWRNLIIVFYQMAMFLVLALVLGHSPSFSWLAFPLSLLLLSLSVMWIGVLMSVFATRYRDLNELMNNLLRLGFFVTPIMWLPDVKPELEKVADLNPFFHMIELLREPLLTNQITSLHWQVAILISLLGWPIAFFAFAKYRRKIAYWI